MTSDKRQDQEFDQYLDGHSSVSKRYRKANEGQPPAELDERILAAVRQELDETPVAEKPDRSRPSWMIPVSIAAVMVLSVSLVITIQDETARSLDSATGETVDSSKQEADGLTGTGENASDLLSPDSTAASFSRQARPTSAAKEIAPEPTQASESPSQFKLRERESFDITPAMDAAPIARDSVQRMRRPHSELEVLEEEMGVADIATHKSDEAALLEQVETLLKQGRLNAARDEISGFLQARPDYPPAALGELLGDERYRLLIEE